MSDQLLSEPSRYLAIARAVTGDDIWKERLRIACALHNVEVDERALILITAECADHITVDEHGTVTTTGVPDSQIDAAIEGLDTEDVSS